MSAVPTALDLPLERQGAKGSSVQRVLDDRQVLR